jgi:aromatic-amino-acid transaminase
LIPFFDSAYQGLGKGIEEDVAPIRLFIEEDHECFIAHSYSKSMALYSERVGALFIRMRHPRNKEAVKSHIRALIRTQYSNPPKHGAAIAKAILSQKELSLLWRGELEALRQRVVSMRHLFAQKLEQHLRRNFSYLDQGCGLFALLGLTMAQIDLLREKHAIYVTRGSRINLAAVNHGNIDLVVKALQEVSK